MNRSWARPPAMVQQQLFDKVLDNFNSDDLSKLGSVSRGRQDLKLLTAIGIARLNVAPFLKEPLQDVVPFLHADCHQAGSRNCRRREGRNIIITTKPEIILAKSSGLNLRLQRCQRALLTILGLVPIQCGAYKHKKSLRSGHRN